MRAAFAHLQPGLAPGCLVLDVGCGGGDVTAALGAMGCRAAGFDIHLPTLRRAKAEHPGEALFAADAQNVPLADASVDALFSFSVLQYVDRARALAECSRVLRPGGRFAIVENLRWNPVSVMYRLRQRLRGHRPADHQRPHAHLEWSRRSGYEAWFTDVRYEAFCLLSPALLFPDAGWANTDAPGSLRGRIVPYLHAVEQRVIRAFPPARRACWIVLVYGTR